MTATLARPAAMPLAGRLRIVAKLLAMALLLLACVPAFYLARLLPGRNPVPRWFLGGIGRIAGVRLDLRGRRPAGGAFLLANHVSWVDIPALAATSGAAFVGHDGLAGMPLLKWLCAMNDTVFIARHDRASVTRQIADVRRALSDTGALAIFPEGTTSDGTGLLAFKSSLLSALEPLPAGIAVQPVLLDYGPQAAEIAWVGDEHGLHNFLRLLARPQPLRVTVEFLPPLTGETLANRKTIAATARAALLERLLS